MVAVAPATTARGGVANSRFKQQRYDERLNCLHRPACVIAVLACFGLAVGGCGLMILGNTVTHAKRSALDRTWWRHVNPRRSGLCSSPNRVASSLPTARPSGSGFGERLL